MRHGAVTNHKTQEMWRPIKRMRELVVAFWQAGLIEGMRWCAALVMFMLDRSWFLDYRVASSMNGFVEFCVVCWFSGYLWVQDEWRVIPWLLGFRLVRHQVPRAYLTGKAFLTGHHEVERRATAGERRVT